MFLLHTIVLLSCVEEKKHDTHTADTIIDTGEIEDTSPSNTDPENTESEDTNTETDMCEGAKNPPSIPDPQTTLVNGQDTIIWSAENPQGVLFFFHGTGGHPNFLKNKLEMRYIVARALAESFSIIAFQAMGEQWDNQNDCNENIDMQNFAEIKELAINNGAMSEETPVFLMGYSNGGSMVRRTSHCYPVSGVALIMVSGGNIGLVYDDVPPPSKIIWSPNRNDETVSADNVIETYNAYVEAGGEGGLLLVNEPSPITNDHFVRINGVSCEVSNLLYTAYRNNNVIDENDLLIQNPRDDQSIWREAIPEQYREYNDKIGPLLHELYSNHYGVTGEYTDEMFDFWLEN